MKTRNTEDLLLFIGCFLFAFGAVSGLMSITVLSAGNVYIMLRVLIFTGLFFLVFKSKRTMLISLGILAAAALYIGTRYLKEEVPVFYEDLALYTAQTIRFINGYTDYEKVYNLITINLLCIFMSFVTVGLIKARLRIILLFLIGAGIFVFANTFSPTGMHITFLPMLAGLFIFVAIKMREGRRGRFKMTAIAVSVGLIAVIISYIMPVPERVRDYYIAYTDTYDFLYKTFRQPFMPKYYTSRTMGFTDTQGELGGWLRADNEFIMFVYADEPVYLRGVSKNIYTGRGWTGENEETFSQNLLFYDDAPDSFVDFTTLISVGYTSEATLAQRGMELKSLRINTGPTSTGTVFQPQKAVEITPEGDYFLIQNEMGDKRMSDIMERYSDYYADYFDVDYKNENILEALKGSKKGYYNDMAGEYERMMEENTVGTLHLRKMRIGSLISLFRNIYAPQAEAIYSKYSSLPTGISQRLYDLANEITKDNDNDYDKLKAIESYLQNNEYTVTPAIIRPDIDFVEGFLFETREGYCTYYASAMAVLSRAIGLPARYVEGYTTPSELTGDYYVVTNLNAHAWAEVYLEGFGWVPFEATPPNYQALYVEKTESGEFRGNEYHELIDDEEMLERMPHLGDVTKERTENNMNFLHYVSFWELVAVIMASFAFLAFFRVLWVTRKEHNIERMIRSEGVIEYYKLILRFLSFYGYSLRDEESAVIYANRVGKHTPMGTNKLRIASEVFSKARYGQGEIPEESYNFVKNIYVQMLMYFKFNTPRVKYYLFRYFKR